MPKNRILVFITIILACIPKMHADDLSDLIAAVSGTKSQNSNNVGYLDDIANVMTENSTYDFILNTVSHTKVQKPNYSTSYRQWMNGSLLTTKGFYRPVPGGVTSNFGWRSEYNRMHHGVDLRLNIGDTVRAAMSGTVKKVGFDANGYGHYVLLAHPDGMETLYGHLQYATTFVGQIIRMGMPVGIGGNTGNSTGPHLHFEARLNGVAIDPTMMFNLTGRDTEDDNQENEYQRQTQQLGTTLALGNSLNSRHTYVVKQGDTPKSISKRAGISVAKLCQLNMLSAEEPLQIGRMLKLK